MRKQVEDGMLDRILGNEIDNCDNLHLPLTRDTGDALLEPSRVPGQIQIDNATCHLEVEAGRAGNERPAFSDRPAGAAKRSPE
jgi:hypothetical protein